MHEGVSYFFCYIIVFLFFLGVSLQSLKIVPLHVLVQFHHMSRRVSSQYFLLSAQSSAKSQETKKEKFTVPERYKVFYSLEDNQNYDRESYRSL